MDEKIVFEDYNIEFADEDFRAVNEETLVKCKQRLEEVIKNVNNKENKSNG